jgi:uncharacterized alkaline shock family protein YloU
MMISVFNRILAVLVALAILAAAVVTIGVAAHAWPANILVGWFEPQLRLAASAPWATRVGIIAMSAVAGIGMLALLLAEILPLRENMVHTLSVTDKGVATIENDSLCLLAERTGETIHDVKDVRCMIQERQDGLRVRCHAVVGLGANLLETNPEMKTKVRETLQQLTGLAVSSVDIKYRYHSDKRGRVSVR